MELNKDFIKSLSTTGPGSDAPKQGIFSKNALCA